MTSDFIAVLANARAGRGRHRGLLPGVLQALGGAGHAVRLLDADSGAGAERACHQAVAEGAVALVAVGGDGTVHRALQAVAGGGPRVGESAPPGAQSWGSANFGAAAAGAVDSGLVAAGAAARRVGFGVVAAGTGNDFAGAVGVPGNPIEAAREISAALEAGRAQSIDAVLTADAVGRQRWFCAVLAAGFDALVNERANRMAWPRGPRRYDLAIVLELARLRARAYTLELDGETLHRDAEIVAVGNTASYGGGMRIVPAADPSDGLLDVIWAGGLGRGGLSRLTPRLRQGTHVTDPRVHQRRARHVRVAAEGIVGYADGERLGPLPLDMKLVPGAIRLLR
ncbi:MULTISPECIES: diacylglycerol kinase family protein [unclassified Actinoplanes]|uniref:diacylglycerol/lipid kinase family protein n=1 Tax=unclassified Actinoplanes TaxID=2626549 RepID=UPI0002D3C960|nr:MULTISPECIES: diacylglycerol kinase family protein [unclassified Actinoplanes]